MNPIRVNRKSLGINFSSRGESEVLVWAPHAEHVSLLLSDKNEYINLEKQKHGYWSCITSKAKPGDTYFYELDHKNKYPDPTSLSQPKGVTGPSEVINLHHFQWTDRDWINLSLKDYIFYEIHTGTFTPSGSFEGIEAKLDYLKELGITAIEIMPVAQFSGTRNWGYDGVFPFAVQYSYGGALALQHLVNACHQKGLAVVLDVVYNHMGPEGNNFGKFGHYFTDKYKTPWGDAINVDDAGSDEVRKYIIENALMWFRDFHIDALRLDAVHAIKDLSPTHILKELKEYVQELMNETGRTHYLIAECDLNDVRFIKDQREDGYGLDAQWIDEFHHALRVTTGNERNGYYKDFEGVLHLAKSFKDGYVYDGMYSPHRDKTFGTKTTGLNGNKFVVFSQNHDHIGNRMLGERTSALVSFEMQKVMAATILMSPFLPLLFMGEEYSETNPFLYFVSHTDNELVESVRKGRRKEFAAFHPHDDVPDPQSESSFENSKLNWSLLENEKHSAMFHYYKELIALRKRISALANLDRESLTIKVYENENVLLVHRWHNEQHIKCIFNFSQQEQHIVMPSSELKWSVLLDSTDKKWNGSGSLDQSLIGEQELTIQPESFLLYHSSNV